MAEKKENALPKEEPAVLEPTDEEEKNETML